MTAKRARHPYRSDALNNVYNQGINDRRLMRPRRPAGAMSSMYRAAYDHGYNNERWYYNAADQLEWEPR